MIRVGTCAAIMVIINPATTMTAMLSGVSAIIGMRYRCMIVRNRELQERVSLMADWPKAT